VGNPAGYVISESTKAVYVYRGLIQVTFSGVSANGTANSVTTTDLTLSFSSTGISGLSASDITLNPALTKGDLTGSGTEYKLAVSGISAGGTVGVSVSKSGYSISGNPKDVTVHYAPITSPWEPGGAGRFVAVSDNNKIAWSSNGGQNWNEVVMTYNYSSVAYGNGVFIALSSNKNVAARSTDGGASWTLKSLPFIIVNATERRYWKSVAYGDGVFVAVAQNSSKAAWSNDDGMTWNQTELPRIGSSTGLDGGWRSVAYGEDGVFIAVSHHWDYTDRASVGTAARSTDGGKTWSMWDVPELYESNAWETVCYGNGVFILGACIRALTAVPLLNDRIARSTDNGETWTWPVHFNIDNTAVDSGTSRVSKFWTSLTYGNGVFVIVADFTQGSGAPSLPNALWSDDNGQTWQGNLNSETWLPADAWKSVTYGGGVFVAVPGVPYPKYTYPGDQAALSFDGGKTWTTASMPGKAWTGVSYGEP
jgi:hypothetical protein